MPSRKKKRNKVCGRSEDIIVQVIEAGGSLTAKMGKKELNFSWNSKLSSSDGKVTFGDE